MTQLEAVFFDLGDTLTDLREGQGDYMARVVGRAGRVFDVLAAMGVQLPGREAFAETLGYGLESFYLAAVAEQRGVDVYDALRYLFAQMEIPPDDELVQAAADEYCRPGAGTASLRIGAEELLQALLARGLRLGVISNTLQPRWSMDQILGRRGLLSCFTSCTYSSEVRVAKPHPEMFRAALRAMDVAPERAVHVGDRLDADVAGAQAVGMKAVLIEVPHRPEPRLDIVPDARIAELPELLEVLPRLFG